MSPAKIGEIRELPDGIMEGLIQGFHRFLVTTTNELPLFLNQAEPEGLTLWDVHDNEYLDFAAGVGVSNAGHMPRQVFNSILSQMETGNPQFINTDFYNSPSVHLAKLLSEIAPGNFGKKVFLSNSGTEANEAAIKIAFDWHLRRGDARHKAVSFHGGFHGRTLGSLAVSSSKLVHKRGFPEAFPVAFFPFPGIDDSSDDSSAWRDFDKHFKHHDPHEVAFVILELIQAEGGVNELARHHYLQLVERAREYGWVVIVDEVQTGLGRTGRMWATEHMALADVFLPDIITSAKALGGGALPCGATIIKKEMDFDERGRHSNTFGGNNLACAAAIAGIETIKEKDLPCNALIRSQDFYKGFQGALKTPKGRKILRNLRGRGLLLGLDVMSQAGPDSKLRDRLILECLKRGLVLMGCGECGIRFEPPLIISEEEVWQGIRIFQKALEAL